MIFKTILLLVFKEDNYNLKVKKIFYRNQLLQKINPNRIWMKEVTENKNLYFKVVSGKKMFKL